MRSDAVVLHQSKTFVTSRDLLVAFCGSLFIALCAQVAVPFPFTTVPSCLQPQAVLVVAALLGSKRGLLAIVAYLCEGAMGLPVFAEGHGGAFWLAGATGGYLWAYLPVTLIVGYLCETIAKSQIAIGLAMLLGSAIILSFGFSWLSCLVGASAAWTMGVAPFVVTDILKVIMATILLPTISQRLRGFLEQA